MPKYVVLLCSALLVSGVCAQRKITLTEAEQALQKNNLQLLAEEYNITAANAAVVQARIWEQPYLSGEINAINPQNQKLFDVGTSGQKSVAIQQLIYLGGKKKNEVAFARSNAEIAQLQFEQVLRNLKFQLSRDFYSLYFDEKKISGLDFQISKLDTLLKAYQVQTDKGNIPLKEVVRLQALLLNLRNEKTSILSDIINSRQEISLITGLNEIISPDFNEETTTAKFNYPKYTTDSLISYALRYNPEYLTALKLNENTELYLRWQKSLAVPDLTTGLSYDQRGGAFQNQVNLTVGIPLPLWNKNKGNIQMAQARLEQNKLDIAYKQQELRNQVNAAYLFWQQQQLQFNSIAKNTDQNLNTVYEGMVSNFRKRNVTLLEFTDFMESYNQSYIQINETRKQWILSGLQLNYLTNTEVF